MKIVALLSLVAALAAPSLPAAAMDSMSMSHGSMAMGGTMAKCASSNPAVIVNTTKMTYMMDTKSNRMAMKGMMDHDKFVCKSTATHMGAKMKSDSMSSMNAMHGHM
jgi:hypothetical protein